MGPTFPPEVTGSTAPAGVLALTRQRGFEYHVFISWPHQIEEQGKRIAGALKEGLENKFRNWGGGHVFLDQSEIDPFHLWDTRIRRALARSAVTLVLLVDSYFLSNYCGLEWSITEQLQAKRLPSGVDASCFYHILLEPCTRLPQEVRMLTPDPSFQKVLVFSRKPERHAKWPHLINSLAEKIRAILALICEADPVEWAEHERIALSADARRFTFSAALAGSSSPPTASVGGTASGDPAPGLPRFIVETSAHGR